MKVVGSQPLEDFSAGHPDARGRLSAWYQEAERATWGKWADVKARYPTASSLSDNRVVFNIGGNRFRLLVRIAYDLQIVVILKVGTHADYDKWELKQ